MRDPNIKMDFKGLVDFSLQRYKFNFYTNIFHVNFKALNLYNFAEKSIASGEITMNIAGNDLDNLTGTILCQNPRYVGEAPPRDFTDFKILLTDDKERKIEIQSKEIANGYIKGNFNTSQLGKFLKENLKSLLSENKIPEDSLKQNTHIAFDLKIYNAFINALLPQMRIADSIHFYGQINPKKQKVACFLESTGIKYKNYLLDSIAFYVDTQKLVNGNLQIKGIQTPYYKVKNFSVLSKTHKDTLHVYTDFVGGDRWADNFQMACSYTLDHQNNGTLGIEKSKIYFKGVHWLLGDTDATGQNNTIIYNWTTHFFDIKKFLIESEKIQNDNKKPLQSSLAFSGNQKAFSLKISDLSLKNITPTLQNRSVQGILNSSFSFVKRQQKYYPKGVLNITNLELGGHLQGDLLAKITGTEGDKYDIDLQLSKQNKKSLEVLGTFYQDKQKPFQMKATLSEFQLAACNAFTQDFLTNIQGAASGDLQLTGTRDDIKIDGFLDFRRAGFVYPYLNVAYQLPDDTRLYFEKNNILIKDIALEDRKYHTRSFLNGTVRHKNLSDIALDLNVKTDRFLVLNTPYQKDISYYGKGFIAGNLQLKGAKKQWQIDVNANVLKGTEFYIPSDNVGDTESFSFIEFKKQKKKQNPLRIGTKEQKNTLSGINLNLDLEITKDAVAQVVIDKVYGSYLKLSGTGNLNISLNDLGNFKMAGIYNIKKGNYNLIYKGIVNKSFQIQNTGRIVWTADPLNPNVSLTAIHNVKADPKVLLENTNINRKIPVNLQLAMEGALFNATQKFDIIIPNTDAMVNSELQFKLSENGENGRLRQFFSLLVTGSFYTQSNTDTYQLSTLKQTSSELVASTISSILNLNNDVFDLSIDYTLADESNIGDQNTRAVDNQLGLYLNTQITDRVLFSGNLEVPMGKNSSSDIMGEFNVELLLNERGDFRGRLFNRRNELQYANDQQEGYTQGTGISYQINFSSIKDILYQIGLKKNKK